MKGKLIIFSAPSGAGKTTIVKKILSENYNLEFSISACSRNQRQGEIEGKDYYFLTPSQFKEKIDNNEFLEWEEVYQGSFYGTLKQEIERIRNIGKNVLFDVDVKGGLNIKKAYGDDALLIFVMPPSIEELERRLRSRSTESDESIKERISKAELEISYANQFDVLLINDDLENAISEAKSVLQGFLK